MKAIQLKISLLGKRKKCMRKLLCAKNTTYEELHQMIQILFNLDAVEPYVFEGNEGSICRDEHKSQEKSISHLKEHEVFYYSYDLIDSLRFKIEVLEAVEHEMLPFCNEAAGKNLYEGVADDVDGQLQSKADRAWINACLAYFREGALKAFFERAQLEVARLVKIRFFQDYMHNQVVRIHLPSNRIVYMGCDASTDVVLNFHINADKLMEYTGINQRAASESIIKYHDCIELALVKRSGNDAMKSYDFTAAAFGSFMCFANVCSNGKIPNGYMHVYLEALARYVDAMTYCQEHDVKYTSGKMIEVEEDGDIHVSDGRLTVYNVERYIDSKAEAWASLKQSMSASIAIDVMTVPRFEHQEIRFCTYCVVGNSEEGFSEKEIFHTSLKTMLSGIFELLEEKWEKQGIHACLELRDTNLKRAMDVLAKKMNVECHLVHDMKEMDKAIGNGSHIFMRENNPQDVIKDILVDLGVDLNELDVDGVLEKAKKIKADANDDDDNKKYS